MRTLILLFAGAIAWAQTPPSVFRPPNPPTSNYPSTVVLQGPNLIQPNWNRVAMIDSIGKLDPVLGGLTNCVLVNGTSVPCAAAPFTFVPTAHQINVVTNSGAGTVTFSLPADLMLSGQSANGTDVLSARRFTDTSPSGNFENWMGASGGSLWRVDITGILQAGVVPFARVSATPTNIVNLFTGCSGVLYLGADGSCHSTIVNPMTALGDLMYGGASGAITRLAGDTSNIKKFFCAQASGGVAQAPTWCQIAASDLPTPTSSTLGGVKSFTQTVHQFVISLSNAGVFSTAQPAAADLSDGTTGSGGAVVLANSPTLNSPTLVTPNLGTPSTVNLSNSTNLPCGATPAFTGDTTKPAGSCATQTQSVNGVAYPTDTSTNTVPVKTGTGAVTYEQVPNNAIQNPNVTVTPGSGLTGCGTVALGGSTTCSVTANVRARAIGAGFDGSGIALTSGATQTVYFSVPFACTISAWNITVDAGTITFDVWKVATGTAVPTSSNSITASAKPALSTGTALHSTTLTGWTTSVSQNDLFGVNINTVSSATKASLILECDQ